LPDINSYSSAGLNKSDLGIAPLFQSGLVEGVLVVHRFAMEEFAAGILAEKDIENVSALVKK
jgi:hypothetical protein